MYGENIDHLSDELQRLDLLLRQQVLKLRLKIRERKNNGDNLLYISNDEVDWLLQDRSDSAVNNPEIEVNRRRLDRIEQEINRKVSASQEKGIALTLPRLAEMFALSSEEMKAVIICLAPELSHKYDTLYAYLQDDITRKKPSIDLILNLLCETSAEKWQKRAFLSREAKLFRSGILQAVDDQHSPSGSSDLATFLKLDRRIVDFIMGNNALDGRLKRFTLPSPAACSLDQVLIDQQIKDRVYNLVRHHVAIQMLGQKMVINLYGPNGAGKRQLAQAICKELNCPLLCLDLEILCENSAELESNLRLAFREGFLSRSIIYLDNIAAIATSERGKVILKTLAHIIGEFGWLVFLAGDKDWSPEGCFDSLLFSSIQVPVAGVPLRERAWQHVFADELTEIKNMWPGILAHRFALTPGQIEKAAGFAEIRQYMSGQDKQIPLTDFFAGCRNQSNHKLAELSVKVEPNYHWDDIVLPLNKKSLLQEICNQIKHQHQVFSQWGFERKVSYGKGLSVLFSGPPGTGKTMASQVIANELGLDLYKIDLSSVVSKYIGETEKNLTKIFIEAERSNAILFFDEADALFGKRTDVKDAHDRYANIETSYLLQKMEEYEGMVILATNLRSNMDEAFTRRIRFIVEFPFPDAPLRAQIWESHFPAQAPIAGNIDYDFLGKRFQVAGGNIKNIVLNTAFFAAEKSEAITMEHILHSVKREFEKIGKLWSEESLYKTSNKKS